MAYVAISNNLVSDVMNKIEGLKSQEVLSLNSSTQYTNIQTSPEVRDAVVNDLWGEFADLKPRIGRIYTEKRVDVRVPVVREGKSDKSFEFTFENIRIPCVALGGNTYSSYYLQADNIAPTLLALEPVTEFIETMKLVWDAEDRWGKVKDDIRKFLNSCKSLNEAVKLYPDIARYVPDTYINKMNAKSEANKKKESAALDALRSIDIENITTSTVLARMAGGAA